MTIICDFDNALFDTRRFLAEIAREWGACGVSQSLFLRSYRRVRAQGLYSPARHILAMRPQAIGRKAILLARVRRLQEGARRFLFKDVKPCLRLWRRRGYRLVLLTYGDRVFQRAKLQHSGLSPLFERVIVTSDPYKIAMVQRLANRNGQAVIIDDNFDALQKLLKTVPNLRAIHLERYRSISRLTKKRGICSVSNLFQADRCLTKGFVR